MTKLKKDSIDAMTIHAAESNPIRVTSELSHRLEDDVDCDDLFVVVVVVEFECWKEPN